MESLKGVSTGRLLVTTVSESRYLIDLDISKMRRMPASDMAADRSLRRGGQEIRVVALKECAIGRPMWLMVNLQVPGVIATTRRSTAAQSIEALGEDNESVWDRR